MIPYVVIFVILVGLEALYIYVARRAGIVDVPTDRSSHRRPVVRGGGVVIYLGALAWWFVSGFTAPFAMIGLTLLAGVSFADDLREVSVPVRLVMQFIGVGFILAECLPVGASVLLWAVALIIGVGLVNAFNFMDGINGLAGLYSFLLFGVLSYIDVFVVQDFIDLRLLVISTLASGVFCLFNFRINAMCFAGDVGSIIIGGLALYALGSLVFYTGDIWWFGLVAVYGVDVVLTLCRRLAAGQNIFRAHRMHAYQLMSNELHTPQLVVATALCFLQAAIDVPLVFMDCVTAAYSGTVVAVLSVLYFTILAISRK